MTFGADIHVPLRMNRELLGDPLSLSGEHGKNYTLGY